MIRDYITAAERLSPPRHWPGINFLREIVWRFRLRKARWELETALKHQAEWRAEEQYMKDLLKSIGADPEQFPEPITKTFEVYLIAAIVVSFLLAGFMFSLYRGALMEMIR